MKAALATLVNTNPHSCYSEGSVVKTEITFAISLGGLLLVGALNTRNATQVRKPTTFQCVLIIITIITKINLLEVIQRYVI